MSLNSSPSHEKEEQGVEAINVFAPLLCLEASEEASTHRIVYSSIYHGCRQMPCQPLRTIITHLPGTELWIAPGIPDTYLMLSLRDGTIYCLFCDSSFGSLDEYSTHLGLSDYFSVLSFRPVAAGHAPRGLHARLETLRTFDSPRTLFRKRHTAPIYTDQNK